MKRRRRVFQNSEPAYRSFLLKFNENTSFNDVSIAPALDHAFSEIFKSKILPDTRIHLIKVILECKEKILNDLEILKGFPNAKIEPLRIKKKLPVVSGNECLSNTNEMTKKRKLSSGSGNQEETGVMNELKKNCSSRRSTRRSSMMNAQNEIKKNHNSTLTSKILKVTIEEDKNLEKMVKNSNKKSKSFKRSLNKFFEKNIENNSGQHLNESNKNHDESVEIEQSNSRLDKNVNPTRIERISIKREIDLLDESLQGDIPIPLPEDVVAPRTFNTSSLEANNQQSVSSIPLMSVSSQENVSSLNIACYNNFIPPIQPYNNFQQIPHMHCCPYWTLMHNNMLTYPGMYNFPIINPFVPNTNHAVSTLQSGLQQPQLNHTAENSVLNQPYNFPNMIQQTQANRLVETRSINQSLRVRNGLQQSQTNQMTENRPISQPLYLQNPGQRFPANQTVSNSSVIIPNEPQPFQLPQTHQLMSSHQSLNPVQELIKLQTAIFNLNSQVASLQNAWNQSQSN